VVADTATAERPGPATHAGSAAPEDDATSAAATDATVKVWRSAAAASRGIKERGDITPVPDVRQDEQGLGHGLPQVREQVLDGALDHNFMSNLYYNF
jgi:hypothetical protein